ncbi:hypothetical protein BIW11_04179 [Tropilaelaps mercedesae]|uniref:Uncharacterized protein n=1 Tax=Tropilaelaps mercedesae TaxID=418985 RepID=A0A1V9X9Y3_9ACAR|nr:hypothetical protein BIW11_04179 [Tropilaelaps mercedesae]
MHARQKRYAKALGLRSVVPVLVPATSSADQDFTEGRSVVLL